MPMGLIGIFEKQKINILKIWKLSSTTLCLTVVWSCTYCLKIANIVHPMAVYTEKWLFPLKFVHVYWKLLQVQVSWKSSERVMKWLTQGYSHTKQLF